VLPIQLFIIAYLILAMRRFLGFPWWAAGLIGIAFIPAQFVFGQVLGAMLRDVIGSSVGYLPAAHGLGGNGDNPADPASSRRLAPGNGNGFICRVFDIPIVGWAVMRRVAAWHPFRLAPPQRPPARLATPDHHPPLPSPWESYGCTGSAN
jgi:hypothetical protein